MKNLLTTVFVCFLTVVGLGQTDPPQIIPPSPEAASLGKYGDVPVSAYTGIPSISIPICQAQSKEIVVPVSISYHASGIRIQEEASRVGLGWALNAGGVITRTIRGYDDFDGARGWLHNDALPLPEGPNLPDYAQAGCEISTPGGNVDYSGSINGGIAFDDLEPDMFFYNFNGYSGKFVLAKDGTPLLAKKEEIEIETTNGSTWTVRTPDGFVYDFDIKEEAGTLSSPTANPAQVGPSTWFLTKISSPSGATVDFSYVSQNGVRALGGVSATWEDPDVYNCTGGGAPTSDYNEQYSDSRSYDTWILDQIDFENGYVKFSYNDQSSNPRIDVTGERRLAEIKVYSDYGQGAYLRKEIEFDNDHYFDQGALGGGGAPGSVFGDPSAIWKRLKLEGIKEKNGSLEKPAHTFTYFEDVSSTVAKLPNKNSYDQDFWGYHNGAYFNTVLTPEYIGTSPISGNTIPVGANRFPDETADDRYIKAGMLKSIHYPTGGYSEFEFEQHDFSNGDPTISVPIPYTKVHNSDNSTTTQFTVDAAAVIGGVMEFAPEFIWDPQAGQTEAAGMLYVELTPPIGSGSVITIDYYDDCINPNSQNCVIENVTPVNGVWTLQAFNNYPAGIGTIKAIGYVNWTQYNDSQNPSQIQKGGGLRVKRIKEYEQAGATPKVRKFDYHYTDNGIEYSHGLLMSIPKHDREVSETLDESVCAGTTVLPACPRFIISSNSVNGLSTAASGSAVGYTQVSQLNGELGQYGKSEFTYVNQADQIIAYEGGLIPGIPNVPNNRNGLLTKQIDYAYDLSIIPDPFRKVKESIYNYSGSTDEETIYGVVVEPFQNTAWLSTSSECRIRLYVYPFHSERIQMASATEIIYDQHNSSNSISSITDSYFDDTYHHQLIRTETTDSEGNERITEFKYPMDYRGSCVYPLDCENTYQSDMAQRWTDRKTCIASIEATCLAYKAEACDSLAACVARRTTYIEEHCYYSNGDPKPGLNSCLTTAYNMNPCSADFASNIVPYENCMAASTCESDFDYYQSLSLSNRQTCLSTFNSCLDTEISNASTEAEAAILTMQKNHILTPVIETYSWLKKSGVKTLVSAVKTNYKVLSSGGIVPDAVFAAELNAPLAEATFLSNPDAYYEPQLMYDAYDDKSNILQYHKENGPSNSYLWGYNQSLPTAQVVNASEDAIAYTGFESSDKGNWTYGGSGSGAGKTGATGFALASQSIQRTGLSAGDYQVSFWSDGSGVNVNGGSTAGYVEYTGSDGWSWYSYPISVAANGTVVLTGTGQIDELRLHPADAQMSTYCYDEALRVETMTDPSGKSVYYEYDGLDRLILIRDQDGHIVQRYDYHYEGG